MVEKTAPKKKPVLKTGSPDSFWNQPVPMYLGILLLVFGILAGAFLFAVFFPPKATLPPEPEPVPLKWSLVSHPDCAMCAAQSSFELLLAQRFVLSDITPVDATSSQGMALVQKYGIGSFPVVLVEQAELESIDSGLSTVLKSKFPTALNKG